MPDHFLHALSIFRSIFQNKYKTNSNKLNKLYIMTWIGISDLSRLIYKDTILKCLFTFKLSSENIELQNVALCHI
jgi:hypothetical protein